MSASPSGTGIKKLTSNQKRVDERGEHGVGCIGSDELTDTRVQELVERHLEVYGTGHRGREAEANDGVPASLVSDGHGAKGRRGMYHGAK